MAANMLFFINALKLIISIIIFSSPGILFATIYKKRYNQTPNFLLIPIISILFSIIFGFLLLQVKLLNYYFINFVYLVISVISFFAIFIYYRRGYLEFKTANKSYWIILFLFFLSIIVFFLMYQSYEFPIGGDSNNHYLYSLQLHETKSFPETELGGTNLLYYPRGVHVSIVILSSIFNQDLLLVYKFFCAILLGLLLVSVYFLSLAISNKKFIAVFSTLFSFYYLTLLILKGNIPMLLGFIFVSYILIFINNLKNGKGVPTMEKIFFPFILFSIILIHLYVVYYLFLLLSSIFLFYFIVNKAVITKNRHDLIFITIISLFAIIFYFLISSDILSNQVAYFNNKAEVLSKEKIFYSSLEFRINTIPFIVLFMGIPILAFSILGVLNRIKKEPDNLIIPNFLVSLVLFFVNIFPIYGREPYFLIFPISILAGYGFTFLFQTAPKGSMRFNRRIFSLLVLIITVISVLSFSFIIINPLIGSNKPIINPATNYLIKEMQNQNLINGEVIASLSSPRPKYISIMTNNSLYGGDLRYFDDPVYRDLSVIYSINASKNEDKEVIDKYNITLIYLNKNWNDYSSLRKKFDNYYFKKLELGEDVLFGIQNER